VHIKEEIYSEIVKSIPIVCVDAIIKKDNQFLVIQRKENPLKGEWWVPGGRVHLGEELVVALMRKLSEELSINIKSSYKLVGIYEDFYNSSSFGEHLYHTISFVYEFNIDEMNDLDIFLDSTISKWRFQNKLPERLLKKMRFIYG
jgi:colanic acid biosynthesis protein WcaH